jgi:hypothetical protein
MGPDQPQSFVPGQPGQSARAIRHEDPQRGFATMIREAGPQNDPRTGSIERIIKGRSAKAARNDNQQWGSIMKLNSKD